MDLLDFEAESLYFDEPLKQEAQRCIEQAAASYGTVQAEGLLMRAYFLEPEHPSVLVALYRYFYYRHQLADALLVADRVLRVFAASNLGSSRRIGSVMAVSGQTISSAPLSSAAWLPAL